MATMSKNPSPAVDAAARQSLIENLIAHFETSGLPCDRINDFATLAVEVDGRILTVKVSAPKLFDKDGETLFDLDTAILAYEDRVAKKTEQDATRAAKAAESARKQAEREAKKAAKAAQ